MARLAATGYRDLTRLASSNPRMNRDILLTNQAAVFHCLDEFIRELNLDPATPEAWAAVLDRPMRLSKHVTERMYGRPE